MEEIELSVREPSVVKFNIEGPPPVHKESTVWTRRQHSVSVRHAHKSYGSSRCPNQVLCNLSMTAAKGTIYGLLGASGCGKTTLLSCIVGRRALNAGEIWVLGGQPGTKGSGVPGNRIGYMPQEISLYGEFSIKETFIYFGWIYGMPTEEIHEKLLYLMNFLDLPSEDRYVKNLSGGQQRRVSFAVALMHDPELLILDEPTVGVDPLLRQSIWKHLVKLTSDGHTTVIITTHYIEEARQAHTIGLMRGGKLLAEESPQVLMSIYECSSLEEVFLKLSREQNIIQPEANISLKNVNWSKKNSITSAEEEGVVGLKFRQQKEMLTQDSSNMFPDFVSSPKTRLSELCDGFRSSFSDEALGKIKAMLHKNFLRLWRNLGVMLFIFFLPVMQVVMFCLAIGKDPSGLKLAIVNEEVNYTNLTYQECLYEKGCRYGANLSCRYLDTLNSDIVTKMYYPDLVSAREAVVLGDVWGMLYFTSEYTEALVARIDWSWGVDEETLTASEMGVSLDMSNQQIGIILQRELQLSYQKFAKTLLKDCNENTRIAEFPVYFKKPIYGSQKPTFTDFVAPGVILLIVFFLAVALTTSALITERTEGLLDRMWVAGVSPGEILFSHVVTQFVVMCGQTALVLIFMILVFKVQCHGNIGWIIVLTILQGFCGMCFGFVISAICDVERNAIQLALGSFYPLLLLSGVIWPTEAIPVVLRYVASCLPLTMATSALRAMLARGWDVVEPEVFCGFISTIIWIVIFLTTSFFTLKYKRQ